jgi:hypothetical protein
MRAIFILLCLLPVVCMARLGDTEAELKARFTVLHEVDRDDGSKMILLYKGAFLVLAQVIAGKVEAITYTRHTKPIDPAAGEAAPRARLTDAEIVALLDANAGSGKWTEIKDGAATRLWVRDADGAQATCNILGESLVIVTAVAVAHSKAKQAKALEGF